MLEPGLAGAEQSVDVDVELAAAVGMGDNVVSNGTSKADSRKLMPTKRRTLRGCMNELSFTYGLVFRTFDGKE
jgi:hypothetical protein